MGQDWLAPLSQSSVSRCVEEIVHALNELLPTYVKFPTTEQERNVVKQGYDLILLYLFIVLYLHTIL